MNVVVYHYECDMLAWLSVWSEVQMICRLSWKKAIKQVPESITVLVEKCVWCM